MDQKIHDVLTELHKKPDLILMDIAIKGDLDGIDVAVLINKKYRIPVIFLTAHSEEDVLKSSKLTGSYTVVTKPFILKQLLVHIKNALS